MQATQFVAILLATDGAPGDPPAAWAFGTSREDAMGGLRDQYIAMYGDDETATAEAEWAQILDENERSPKYREAPYAAHIVDDYR